MMCFLIRQLRLRLYTIKSAPWMNLQLCSVIYLLCRLKRALLVYSASDQTRLDQPRLDYTRLDQTAPYLGFFVCGGKLRTPSQVSPVCRKGFQLDAFFFSPLHRRLPLRPLKIFQNNYLEFTLKEEFSVNQSVFWRFRTNIQLQEIAHQFSWPGQLPPAPSPLRYILPWQTRLE